MISYLQIVHGKQNGKCLAVRLAIPTPERVDEKLLYKK
jgi:hypothetical protein